METLSEILPIIIYFLLIILIVVLIILGIKLLYTVNKVDELVDDVNHKVKSLDKLFNIIDLVDNRFSIITDAIVGIFNGIFGKLFNKKESEEE